MMKMLSGKIAIIADTSGGMREFSKNYVLRNLCRFVQEVSKDGDIYFWNNSLSKIDLSADIPEVVPSGVADLGILLEKIENNMLILSDGLFKISAVNKFIAELKKHPQIKVRTVAIGADANKNRLKDISTNKTAYSPEDIYSALQSLLYSQDKK